LGANPIIASALKISTFLLLVSLLLFTACSRLISQPSALSSKKDDVYKIAVVAPQVGPYKSLGLSIIHGAELAVQKKNESGGINGKKIELIKIDDGGLAGEGTWRAKSLVSEMVLGVIGHLNSDISIPASEIYSKAKIPQISPASTSPFFTERKATKGFVFRTIGRDDAQGLFGANFVIQKGYKKVAVLCNNRSYGASLAQEFVKSLNSVSGDVDVVFYETYKVDAKNFSKEVKLLKEKSPEFIFFVGEYGDAARFVKELRALGITSIFLGSEGVFDQEFIEIAKTSSEGAYIVSLPQVRNEEFVKSYKDKFKKELGSYSANSFDAASILISAIEKVKENKSENIAKLVRETKDFPGLTGKISFDEKGDLIKPAFEIYEVKNGMFVAVR
jgi:branched-chain amino acid transport system substrate-binding protein